MRKRYPETTRLLILIAGIALLIGLSVVWLPAVFIFIAAAWGFLLVEAIRADRKRRR